jgi:hypothetical protein
MLEIEGGWRNAHHEEPHGLYSLSHISRKITSWRIRCAGYVARVGKKINAFRFVRGRYQSEELWG